MAGAAGGGKGVSRRSDVTSFLARKGFLFADDLDIGQVMRKDDASRPPPWDEPRFPDCWALLNASCRSLRAQTAPSNRFSVIYDSG